MSRPSLLLLAIFLLAACATTPMPPPAAVSELAPSGTLRAAINFGNAVLAQKDATGAAAGITVDLARELARRLGVPITLVTYDAAGKVVDDATKDKWDVGFVAIDPIRGKDIAQTPPYVQIEGVYAVREGSPLRSNEEVDRPGTRVTVARNSAYDLYLTRNLKQATIERDALTSQSVVDTFLAKKADVAAAVKQQIEMDVKRVGGMRLLPGRFMVINQAMGTPKGRGTGAGAAYLREFIEEMKASGFVAESIRRHRIEGAALAPPGDAR